MGRLPFGLPGKKTRSQAFPQGSLHGQHPGTPLVVRPVVLAAEANAAPVAESFGGSAGRERGAQVPAPGFSPSWRGQRSPGEKTWDPDAARSFRLGREGFITTLPGEGGLREPTPPARPRGDRKEGRPRQSPAERFLGSGFSFRGVQPVTSRRSLTARGFPLTVKAVGLAGVFLSY